MNADDKNANSLYIAILQLVPFFGIHALFAFISFFFFVVITQNI
jgi:hypothetical protein